MKLTRAADFAVRLLRLLAAEEGEHTSQELSKKLDIPYSHLAKLVQQLSRGGFLMTRKGKGGGLRLSCDPGKTNLYEVIEYIEGAPYLSHCLLHRKSCAFSRNCGLRKCLGKMKEQIKETLSAVTIQDLAVSA